MQYRLALTSLCSTLTLLAACNDKGSGAGDGFGSLTDSGVVPTGGNEEAGEGSGSSGGASSGSGAETADGDSSSGDASSDSSGDSSGSDDGSSSTTGDEVLPPRECNYDAGCHDDTTWQNASVGVNSLSPVGCEGESFRPTASFQITGGGGIPGGGGGEAHRSQPVIADFTEDGIPDVILNPRKSTTFIVPGDGTGDFPFSAGTIIQLQTPGAFSSGWGLDAGDIDGNGSIDVAAGDHGWSAATWFNSGAATFSLVVDDLRSGDGCGPVGCGQNHQGAGVADLTGDSTMELILGPDQFASGHVDFASYDGLGWTKSMSPPAMSGSTGYIAFADMDNDGDNDIFGFAAAGSTGLQGQTFNNQGDGTFNPAGFYDSGGSGGGGADPRQGGVGDLDCDGFVDLAVGGRIWFGTGTSFNPGPTVNNAIVSHLADMNGDGHLDLVTQSVTDGLAMYYNDGTGRTWTREYDGLPDETYAQLGSPLTGVYGMDIADIDGNGNLDIVRIAGFGGQWQLEAWSR